MERKQINKIYLCVKEYNNTNIPKQILIHYNNDKYEILSLSDNFELLTKEKQKLEIERLEKKLSQLSTILENKNIFDNKHVIVFKEGTKLEKELEQKIVEAERVNNNINMYYEENFCLTKSIIFTSFLGFLTAINNSNLFLAFYNLLASDYNLKNAINLNKKRTKLKTEKETLKKLKLYFSYFVFIFNIGLCIAYLDSDEDKNKFEISIEKLNDFKDDLTEKKLEYQQKHHYQELTNPFENEIQLSNCSKFELLKIGIENNPIISKEDFDIICSLEEFIIENPYFNYKEAYDKLVSLKIITSKSDKGKVAATYNKNKNKITIYNIDEKDEEEYLTNLEHELLHSIRPTLNNYILEEGMTTLLQAEYFNGGVTEGSYYDHVALTKIFCELITPKKMLEAYSTGNMKIIETEMLKIHNNQEDYDKLISIMQEFGTRFNDDDISIYDDNYTYMLSKTETLNMIFSKYLKPFIQSPKVTLTQKEACYNILYRIGDTYWQECIQYGKIYFNNDDEENNLLKKEINY